MQKKCPKMQLPPYSMLTLRRTVCWPSAVQYAEKVIHFSRAVHEVAHVLLTTQKLQKKCPKVAPAVQYAVHVTFWRFYMGKRPNMPKKRSQIVQKLATSIPTKNPASLIKHVALSLCPTSL